MSVVYKTNSIIKPIRDVIFECPFLLDYNITIDPVGYETFVNEQNMSNQGIIGVEYSKINVAGVSVIGTSTSQIDRVFSFRFIQERKPEYTNISDFLTNFVEWLDFRQQSGLTPKFSYERKLDGSMNKIESNKEYITAANASLIAENDGLSIYNVDIHVKYIIKYESIGRCY